MNLSASYANLTRHLFPHLPGAQFGIQEALDEAGCRPFLGSVHGGAKGTQNRMSERFRHRKSLDALCTPFGGNFPAGYAPHFFGVVLEEGPIEAVPKAIDEEVFQGHLRNPVQELRLA